MMTKKTFKVTGMSCQNCVKHVKEAADKIGGVVSSLVSLEEGSLTVEYDESTATSSDIIIAVSEAGYPTSLFKG